MLGEKVTVVTFEEVGENDLGEPICEPSRTEVEGVLVRPLAGSDLDDEERPEGIRVDYSLCFPKTYDGPSLEHARIVLADRGMSEDDALLVVGRPDILRPCPTKWNMVVKAGRVYG